MRRLLFGFVISAVGVWCTASWGETVDVPDGDAINIGQTGSGENNGMSTYVNFAGNGTLTQIADPGKGTEWDYCNIWASLRFNGGAGTCVTYDRTACEYMASPRLSSVFSAPNGGRVVLKTTSATPKVRLGTADTTTSGSQVNYALFNVNDFRFVNADGAEVSGTVVIDTSSDGGSATIGAFPHKSVTSVAFSPDRACAALAGTNIVDRLTVNNALDLSVFGSRVYLFPATELTAATTVRSYAGQRVQFRACTIAESPVKGATWSAVGAWPNGQIASPVQLNGGTLEVYANNDVTFAGKVSGGGTLNMIGTSYARTFAELDGAYEITGDAASATSTVRIEKLAVGAQVRWSASRITVEEGANIPANVLRTERDGYRYLIVPDDNGYVPAELLPKKATLKLTERTTLADGTFVSGEMPSDAASVSAAAGARVTLLNAGANAMTVVPGEGTIVITNAFDASLPAYWYDFSRADTVLGVGAYYGNDQKTTCAGYKCIERCDDWRYDRREPTLWNRRFYYPTDPKAYDFVYPQLRTYQSAKGDLTYAYVEKDSRRLPFARTPKSGESYEPKEAVALKTVIMVFGSQNGGGNALIGTTEGAFGRTDWTTSAGVTTNTHHRIWVNGAEINPTDAALNGGWQVITLNMDDLHFNGIGFRQWSDSFSAFGGQCYGEILLFDQEITDVQRRAYEHYLAEKWGIADYQDTVLATRVLGRSGTLEITTNAEVTLQGSFAGRVELKGAAVKIAEPLPPSADDIAAIGGKLDDGWYDADDADTIVEAVVKGTSAVTFYGVRGLLPRGKTESSMVKDEFYYYGVGDRAPYKQTRTSGFAPSRTWIDFNHPSYEEGYRGAGDDGNTLRFATWNGSAASPARSGVDRNVKTIFMALDSRHGGGKPISSAVGTGGDFGGNGGTLISSSSSANVKASTVRLNGVTVDSPTTTAFTGEPEVLSLTVGNSASAKVMCVDYYGNSQDKKDGSLICATNGTVMGEALYFAETPNEADQAKIEAYLMAKWTGVAPDGYSDLREATLAGNGTVDVADAARLPKVDAGFTGALTVGGTALPTLDVTIDAASDTVTGALAAEGAVMTLPSGVGTINVDFAETPKKAARERRYVLFACSKNVNGTTWNVTRGANVPAKADIVRTATKVELVLPPSGLIIQYR